MDGLTLLRRAHEAGLAVVAEGDRLVIRGPKRAERVAQLLIEHKPEVLAALAPAGRSPCAIEQNKEADDAEATWWRDRFSARLVHWFRGDRGWGEAELIAYGELIIEWHKRDPILAAAPAAATSLTLRKGFCCAATPGCISTATTAPSA
jgi:hypothetical protein